MENRGERGSNTLRSHRLPFDPRKKKKGKREEKERKGNESHDQSSPVTSPLSFPLVSTAKLRDSPSTRVRVNGRVDMLENDPACREIPSIPPLSLYPSHPLTALLFRLPFNPVATNSKRGRFRIREKFDGPNLISL